MEYNKSTTVYSKQYVYSRPYKKKVIYADRPANEQTSNDITRESWSYHSLYPSM
ncbi:MAG: hypothetical protein QXO21_06095 [Candidatus Anstonellales archaeon]